MDVRAVATLLLAVGGAGLALAALYLLVLAVAALRRPVFRAGPQGTSRLAVLIPAHDEAELLPRCLASLRTQSYPRDRYRVVVVADNCADDTASVARAEGAEVLVRDDPDLPGKGRALRWAMDRLLAEAEPVDGVVVDADSVAAPGLITGLEAAMARGAEAVQGEYLVLDDGTGSATPLRQAAFLLFHRVRFSGRDALGMPCSLVGNGMLFRSSLLRRLPWDAFTGAEDLEYSVDLRLAGVRPRFAPEALVSGPASALGSAGATQRMRWEGGRLHVVRTRIPRLLAAVVLHGRWSLLDAVLDLAVPPLGLMAMAIVLGGGVSLAAGLAGAVALWSAVPWGAAAVMVAAYVVTGLRAARAPSSAYRALLSSPRFLIAKLGTYRRMLGGSGADRWERTERPEEARRRAGQPTPQPLSAAPRSGRRRPARGRVDVLGVPVDAVGHEEAVDRVLAAVESGGFCQVCTVNLQFLVTARRRPEVARILSGAELNVADGAPVLWLSHLLGHRLPERVAGSDLVPSIAAHAEWSGARLFLLGGRGGVTQAAAAELRRRHPRLQVSGTLEPPLASLSEMPDDEIVARIREAGADILLVGFGHPKQDLWIAANRHRLPVSVAIGVGGSFDLIAGRLNRAPAWARRSGLEWLYRLVQEPRRLAVRYATCAAWLVVVLVPLAAWRRLSGGTAAPLSAAAADEVPLEAGAGTAVS